MRKIYMVLLSILISMGLTSQNFPVDDNGNIEFSEVVEINLTKQELFSNAKEWLARTFGDYKGVIQFEDAEEGKLISKGHSDIDFIAKYGSLTLVEESLSYTIIIECKDGKYRYRFNDVISSKKTSLMGRNLTPYLSSPIKHKEEILRNSILLDSLNSVDVTQYKKKELEKHGNNITNVLTMIKNEDVFYNKEYAVMINLIHSLKKAMTIEDDF